MATDRQSPTLLLLWRNLGPYHLARVSAAAVRFERLGVRTVAVELAGSEETRDWNASRAGLPFEIVTISQDQRLTDRSRSLAPELQAKLDAIQPAYLAVAGYDRPEMRAAFRWAKRHGAASVLMSETKWDDRPRKWWKLWLASREVALADAALVSGSASGEYLVTLGMPRERIFRQYGAVDNDYFAQAAADQRETGRKPYFISCCRLIEQRKNIKTLLKAYAAYRRQTPGECWDLMVCGDGVDRAELEACARQWCDGGVQFPGFQQVERLAPLYASAGCFVHSAVNEAWGLVVNEAMAAGLPVLVSRRCGCAFDLVHEHQNGFTFNPYDVDELAQAMLKIAALSEQSRREMGRRSQQIIKRFGCEAFAEGLENAFCSARPELRQTATADEIDTAGETDNSNLHDRAADSVPSPIAVEK